MLNLLTIAVSSQRAAGFTSHPLYLQIRCGSCRELIGEKGELDRVSSCKVQGGGTVQWFLGVVLKLSPKLESYMRTIWCCLKDHLDALLSLDGI
ncbi:uncharacterized protein [Physcomitrium patens]|uniref:uncharacterized protein isoform X2 n=1 Tax=Physcomitrium patens TaxID=3218 RepID=UPI003CCCFEC0